MYIHPLAPRLPEPAPCRDGKSRDGDSTDGIGTPDPNP